MTLTIIYLIICTCLFSGCADRTQTSGTPYHGPHHDEVYYSNEKELNEILQHLDSYSNNGNYSQFMSEAKALYRHAQATEDTKGQLLFGAGIAHMYVRMDKGDSAAIYLDRLIPIAEKEKDRASLTMMYNTYAMYSLYYSLNYDNAISYFMKAIEMTDKSDSDNNYLRLINNLAHTYNLKKDTAGLQYSKEVYDIGIRKENEYLIFIGAANSATQHSIRGNWEAADRYIRQAIKYVDKFHNKMEIYSTYANILAHFGENEMAEEYFHKAIDIKDETESVVICGLYNNYGDFLLSHGRTDEAIEVYNRAIKIALETKSYMYRHELYMGLSKAYSILGDTQGELENFKMFHFLSDSLFSAEKERVINDLRVKYETEKMQRKLSTSYFIIFSLVVILFAITAFFLHKRKRDKEMVSRHYESFRREQSKKISAKGDESAELFRMIEDLMNEKKIWKECDLSIETVAQQLNSNRSYISNVINQYAGVPFRQYINSFRIAEAVAILSDSNSDIPLKVMYAELGFNSTSSFYRAFQAITGVSPSKYRKEIFSIRKEEKNS